MSHRKNGNSIGVALGAAVIGSLSLSQLAAASPAFQVRELASGYLLAAATEGACGLRRLDKNKDGKISFEEAAAAGVDRAHFDALDLNHDGVLDNAEIEATEAAMPKGTEGGCGGNKKDAKGAEGGCGGHGAEGGCGGLLG